MTPTDLEQDTYEERRRYLIEFYAAARGKQPAESYELICRMRLRQWNPACDEIFDRLIADPHGDMFWMIPTTLMLAEGDGVLSPDRLGLLRSLWRTYTPYRGDTENHWLMYYASLYVMAERYPGEPGEAWFNGRSSDENLAEARGYIEHWAQRCFDDGQTEFDSPHYLNFFLAPLALLFGYASDERVRALAETMLNLLTADFAADQHNGLYAGAFSRVYPQPALERWRNGSTTCAWLLFGNVPLNPDPVNRILPRIGYRPHAVVAVIALSGYAPPDAVARVALDRSGSTLHLERHRTRTRIRYAPREEPICKSAFMTPDFALGSVQGGLLQPIQQHSWEVLWRTPHPFDGYNVFFTLHPYSSPNELGMYFPEEPLLATSQLAASEKPTYDRPEKWTGGSPFERLYQHRNILIALYDIPPATRFPFVSGYVSRRLATVEREDTRWLVFHADDVFIGYYPLADFSWHDEDGGDRRMHSPHLKNGAVVVCARRADYVDAHAFHDVLSECRLAVRRYPQPSVSFVTPDGDTLVAGYTSGLTVNGTDVPSGTWPRYAGDFMRMTDSGDIVVNHRSRSPLLLRRSTTTLS